MSELKVAIKEYLKLSRSFNMLLTGVAPVLGAISAGLTDPFPLFALLAIGCLGHIYGFTQNDVVDYKIDSSSSEISERPLISGTVSLKNATRFYMIAGVLAYLIAIPLFPYASVLFFMILAMAFVTIYNFISKKYPFMDFPMAFSVGFFVLVGAAAAKESFDISGFSYMVAAIGAVQVFFMNGMIGGLKDLPNDYRQGARTAAVVLGMKTEDDDTILWTNKFRIYGMLPVAIWYVLAALIIMRMEADTGEALNTLQVFMIILIGLGLALLTRKILTFPKFERDKLRKLISLHYTVNYMTTPIILVSITPVAIFFIFIPFIGLVLSNLLLHGTVLAPKTM